MGRSILAFVLLASAVAFAQAPVRDVPASAARSTIVRGILLADDTGIPLPRARVDVLSQESPDPIYTDETGRFLAVIPADGATIRVQKAGYLSRNVNRQLLSAGSGEVTLRMVRSGAINGSVLDSTGLPAVGVRVRAVRVADDGTAGGAVTTDTNDLGEFRMGNLAAGRYAVMVDGGPNGRGGRRGDAAGARGGGAPDAAGRRGRGRGGRALSPDLPTVVVNAGQEAATSLVSDAPSPLELELQLATAVDAFLSRTPSNDGQRAPSGSIEGRILSADGAPVRGASVQVTSVSGEGRRLGVTSDATGRYQLTNLSPGRFTLRVSKSGFPSVDYGQSRALQAGREITVAEGQRVQRIDVTMPRSALVSGTIVDAWGEPVEGVRVQVWQSRFADGRITFAAVGSPRPTDDRGRYRLWGLLPGTYVVVATGDTRRGGGGPRGGQSGPRVFYPGVTTMAEAVPVYLDVAQDMLGADFAYAPGRLAVVEGAARNSRGEPVRGRVVMGTSFRSHQPAVPTRTAEIGSDGAFQFDHVPPGDYVVQVVEGATPQRGGRGQAGGQQGGQRAGGRGRAAGAGGGAPAGGGQGGARGGATGNRGNFEFVQVQLAVASTREFGSQFVTIGDGGTYRVTVDTAPGATVTGEVVLEGESTGVQPSNFAFAADAADLDAAPLAGSRQMQAAIRDDWSFELSGVDGAVRFISSRAPSGWWLKAVNVGGVNAAEDPATFGRGADAANVRVVFASGAGEITGHVLDERRQAVKEYAVAVFSTSETRWFNRSPYVQLATPTQDGSFTASSLPPGEYYVAAVERLDGGRNFGDWQNPDVLQALVPAAQRVVLRQGQTATTELRLASGR